MEKNSDYAQNSYEEIPEKIQIVKHSDEENSQKESLMKKINFFFLHKKKMVKKYYQRYNKKLKKKPVEDIKIFLRKKKIKSKKNVTGRYKNLSEDRSKNSGSIIFITFTKSYF